MVTCPMCGTRKYDHGYDDGSTEVCYRCRNWGPPEDDRIKELEERIKKLERELKK